MAILGRSNRLNVEEKKASEAVPQAELDNAFSRLVLILGIVLALSGFVVLPLGLTFLRDRGWDHIVNFVWMVLPTIALLVSLRDWLQRTRVGATADAIAACGVACIWLILVGADIAQSRGNDLGLVPYIVAASVLLVTICGFWVFLRAVAPDGNLAKSPVLGWLYWTLVIVCVVVMVAAFSLTFYFQVWLA
jgi:hypothetical protein